MSTKQSPCAHKATKISLFESGRRCYKRLIVQMMSSKREPLCVLTWADMTGCIYMTGNTLWPAVWLIGSSSAVSLSWQLTGWSSSNLIQTTLYEAFFLRGLLLYWRRLVIFPILPLAAFGAANDTFMGHYLAKCPFDFTTRWWDVCCKTMRCIRKILIKLRVVKSREVCALSGRASGRFVLFAFLFFYWINQ